jgi:hypothetical protein
VRFLVDEFAGFSSSSFLFAADRNITIYSHLHTYNLPLSSVIDLNKHNIYHIHSV